MPVVKSIRDLFSGGQDSNPTLQDHANDRVTEQERYVLPPENPLFTARMPGGPDDHPMVESQKKNPFCGISPQKVSALLRAGMLEPAQERQARAWIDQYQKMTIDLSNPDSRSEVVYDSRNHDFEEPEVTGENKCGLRRADPWPFE